MGIFHKPLLSDLPVSRRVFQAGDRILVRVSSVLTHDQYHKVSRAVRKYVNQSDVRILIVNCLEVQVLWHHAIGGVTTLASRSDAENDSIGLGVANLNCAVPDFMPGDRIEVIKSRIRSDPHRLNTYNLVREWTGKDVEVNVLGLIVD